MLSGVAPVGGRVAHDQPDTHDARRPASSCGNLLDQPAFAIEGPEKLVDVDELRLQLEHDQVPGRGVPGQLIDDASLAVDRKRHLRLDYPAGRAGDEAGNAVGKP